jgi:hypothetical protein
VGAEHYFDVVKGGKLLVGYGFEPFGLQSLDLVAVVDNVAEAVEGSVGGKLFFGFADSGCHSEAEARIFVNLDNRHVERSFCAGQSFVELIFEPPVLLVDRHRAVVEVDSVGGTT